MNALPSKSEPATEAGTSRSGRSKRIVQVVSYISEDSAFGGPVAVALAQSVELARRGHTVHLVAGWDGVAKVQAPGVTVHLRRAIRLPGLRLSLMVSPALPFTVRRLAKSSDVVHLHFGRDLISLSSWVAVRPRHAPIVLQTHGMVMPDNRYQSRLIDFSVVRAALRSAKAVLSLTEVESMGLHEVAGRGTSPPITLFFNGVVVNHPVSFARSRLEVLFMARLHPRKKVLTFAEMAKRLLSQGIKADFRILGPDEGDLPQLLEYIHQNGISEHVSYKGPAAPQSGPGELEKAALYVLPSVGEVYPMTVLEAISVGTPTLITTACGLAETLSKAGAAAVAEPDIESLTKAAAALLTDEDSRLQIAKRALETLERTMSISAVAIHLEDIYSSDRPNATPKPPHNNPGRKVSTVDTSAE